MRMGKHTTAHPAYNTQANTPPKPDLSRRPPWVRDPVGPEGLTPLLAGEGQPAVTEAVRAVLAQLRDEISTGHLAGAEPVQLAVAGLEGAVARQLRSAMAFSLRPVINATGVILHTNLGRAPLAEA